MEQAGTFSLSLLQKGDPGAVAAMLDAHGDRLLRAAYFFCRDRSDSQDLVQETFCRAIPALGEFRGDCLLYTWLYGILRNLCFSHLRQQRNHVALPDRLRVESDERGPEWSAEAEERSIRLAAMLDGMPAKQREILMLRFAEEMKLGEIAELLGISSGTVKSRLHEALKRLRDKLPQEWGPAHGREKIHEMQTVS